MITESAVKENTTDSYIYDFMIDDREIQKLANMSHHTKGIIEEYKSNDGYSMIFKMYDRGKESESVLIFSSDGEKYKEASKTFFQKFIKYNGDISLSNIFGTDTVIL